MNEELRLTDAIPKKLTTYATLALIAGAAIAGILLLDAWMPVFSAYTGGQRITAFDLTADASLSVYFSSAMLLMASLVAVLIYMIRRHRLDDYHGQYRIWLWAALCWFVFSVDEVAQLHQGFKALMVTVTGTKLHGDGSLWWIIPYFFCLGAVGLRLLIDVRESILSTAVGILAAVCCLAAVAVHCELLPGVPLDAQVIVVQGLKMGAETLLLLTMLLYGRHVILDAEGKIPVVGQASVPAMNAQPKIVVRKPRKTMAIDFQEIPADSPASAVATDPPHSTPPAPLAASLTLGTHSQSPPQPQQGQQKLTKAQRKALRKRLDNMRQERENGK